MTSKIRPSLARRIGNSLRLTKRRRGATIDMTADGFVFTIGRKATQVRWDEITQIDGGVRDFISYDTFYVVIHADKVRLTIEEFNDGFRQLESTIFERWPRIKDRWQRLFSLPLHQAHYEVLWRRGEPR